MHAFLPHLGRHRVLLLVAKIMREGGHWELSNKLPQEAFNPSNHPHIHLIFDLRKRTSP